MSNDEYEYRRVLIPDEDSENKVLAEMGKDGWQLCAVVNVPNGEIVGTEKSLFGRRPFSHPAHVPTFYFKRLL
jgi:hypothetical protein